MKRGEAKIFVHEKCDGALDARKGHAAKRAEFRLDHVVLDALHQGRRHGAKAVRLVLRGQAPSEAQAIAKQDRAGLHARESC